MTSFLEKLKLEYTPVNSSFIYIQARCKGTYITQKLCLPPARVSKAKEMKLYTVVKHNKTMCHAQEPLLFLFIILELLLRL